MFDIFISYSHKDFDLVKVLTNHLKQDGFLFWWDEDLLYGDDFAGEINDHLENALVVIVIWTQNSRKSKWVNSEYKYAVDHNKDRFPLVFDMEEHDVSVPFNGHHMLNITNWDMNKNHELYTQIVSILNAKLKIEKIVKDVNSDQSSKAVNEVMHGSFSGSSQHIETIDATIRGKLYKVKLVAPHASSPLKLLEQTLSKQRALIYSSQAKMKQAHDEQFFLFRPLPMINYDSPTQDAIMAHGLIQILVPMINSRGGSASFTKPETFSVEKRVEIMRNIADRIAHMEPKEISFAKKHFPMIYIIFISILIIFVVLLFDSFK